MFFKNSKNIRASKAHCSSEDVAQYFLTRGIPQFGLEDGNYIFLNTEEFSKLLESAPQEIRNGVILKA